MSKESIFSTYRTGENRVTASILAVLRNLSLNRLERILSALMEESSFQLVKFTNQDASSGVGVPDASISASVDILIETKIVRNDLRKDQLDRHLKNLKDRKDKGGFKSSILPLRNILIDTYRHFIEKLYLKSNFCSNESSALFR